MYIGSLTDKNSPVKVSYYYTKRGLDDIIYPGLIKENEEKETYETDGNLFCDYIGFAGTAIGHSGVDIHFLFDNECYVDLISFVQKPFSQIKNLTVYSVTDGNLRPVGRHFAENGKNISSVNKRVNMNADGTIKYDENDESEITPIRVSVGVNTKHLILRIDADYLHIAIGNMDILGAVNPEEVIYPIPREMKIGSEVLGNLTGIYAESDDAKSGALYFEDCLSKHKKLSFKRDGNIRFLLKEMKDEAFEIEVNKDGATVMANSKRGFVYGGAKLLQLYDGNGLKFAQIKDEPYMGIRGVHVALPAKKDLEFLKRLIKYVYVPLGYNTVIMQISALMEYKRHPKINEAWVEAVENFKKGLWPAPAHYGFLGDVPYTQDEVRELCAYIRSFGLEIAAEIQTFGHVQYVTMAYPHMAEPEYSDDADGDEYGADERPTSFYHHCMCPLHEDYYKVFYDIVDEVCEVIAPEKYIHIGHDEIYTYGKCEKCRKVPVEKLFADEVCAMHDYIASKGLKTMMWSDMIVKETYSIPGAIDLIPKDVVCLPFTWYFHLDDNTEKILADHGFEYVIGNFYSSHYPRFTERKTTPGWLGAQVSAWVNCSEDIYCYEGKIFELIYSANMMWNGDFVEEMRNTYSCFAIDYASKTMKNLRQNDADFKRAEKIEFAKNVNDVPHDIRHELDNAVRVGTGQTKKIEVEIFAKMLWFVNATDKNGGRIPWQNLKEMGHYKINYADGESVETPIYYGRDIAEYNRPYAMPLSSPLFRHEGYLATCYSEPVISKTEDGGDYVLYARPFENPFPQKKISSVEICHIGQTDASIILFDVYAL